MNQNRINDVDSLTEKLLKKCEVSSLAEFYLRWLRKFDHIISISRISDHHKNFTEEKIKKDILELNQLCLVYITNFTKKPRHNQAFNRKYYLIDAEGLIRIFKAMRNNNILMKTNSGELGITIEEIFQLFGIKIPKRRKKFVNLLFQNIQNSKLYALILPKSKNTTQTIEEILDKNPKKIIFENLPSISKILETPNSYSLIFYPKLKHPENRKILYKILFTVLIGIAFLSIFLPVLFLINK